MVYILQILCTSYYLWDGEEQRKYFHGLNENIIKRREEKKKQKQKIKIEWLFVALEHFICLLYYYDVNYNAVIFLMRVLHGEFCIAIRSVVNFNCS